MFSRIRSALGALVRRRRFERELSSELETHLELLTKDLIERGLSPQEARRRARAEFGSLDAAKEGCREAAGAMWLEGFARDARFAFRLFAKSPGFTGVVVAILALSIGANAAMFSVVDAVLLRGLPYPEPERLVQVMTAVVRGGEVLFLREAQDGISWEAIRDEASFIAPAVYSGRSTGVNLLTDRGARYVQRGRVSSGFFATLGVAPFLGREFTMTEDRPGGPPVALLSYGLYRSAFDLDPAVLGRQVTLRGEPYTVVGVMPEDFATHVPADLWTPIQASASGEGGGSNYTVIGRLPRDVSWNGAESRIRRASERATSHLRRIREGATAELTIVPLERALTGDVRLSLVVALASVLIILLIGCANVSGLMMARAKRRSREIATRMLLGGGRAIILRQLLTEAVLLSVLGGALGVVLGFALVEIADPYVRESLGIWQQIRVDARVLAAAGVLALGSSVLFSLVPALSSAHVSLQDAVIADGSRSVAGSRSHRPRHVLVFLQLACTFVLLVAAGLMAKSLGSLRALEPGFDRGNLLTASFSLDDERYQSKAAIELLFDRSLQRIRTIAGVESAAIALSIPYEQALNINFGLNGEEELTNLIYVTPGYFETLRVGLLRGRTLHARDDGDSRDVVLVSLGFAERFFPNRDALGARIDLMGRPQEIVGVVSDVQQKPNVFGGYGPIGPVPAAYVPVSQFEEDLLTLAHKWFTPSLVVRTLAGGVDVSAISNAMESVDPLLPFAEFRGFDALRHRALARERFRSSLLNVLATVALFLAITGTSALIAQAVAERKRELGIRLALGASRLRAVKDAATPGVVLGVAGVAAGAAASRLMVPVLESFLWNVSPTDVRTFLLAAVGLLLAAAAASFLPALAVTRLDPARTLRAE